MSNGTDLLLWAYVALAALAGLALVASRWPAWGKGLLVLAVTTLYFVADRALDESGGWPSQRGLPERFVLLAAMIEEPTKHDPGALYVWVHALQDGKPVRRPRAYRLPYAKDVHALLDEAMKKVRQGVTQLGSAEPKRGRSGFSWLRPGSDETQVKIRDMPVPQLPEK
ncbi:MAG: hypothetical protein HZC37_08485 [Burkholderiales bacterium]|nr:hypothetical protein [Burkholderiales bacterium]